MHVDNSCTACQPHLTTEALHMSQRGRCQHVTLRRSHMTIPTKIRPLTERLQLIQEEKRWSRKRRMTAQMYNSFIYHASLFSSHQSKPTKSLASPFLSLKMSSVGACLRQCRREKGQILCVHFDFLEFCLSSALEMGQIKLSQKGGICYPKLGR